MNLIMGLNSSTLKHLKTRVIKTWNPEILSQVQSHQAKTALGNTFAETHSLHMHLLQFGHFDLLFKPQKHEEGKGRFFG